MYTAEMNMKEMETVSAGTVGEMQELVEALSKSSRVAQAICVGVSHIPGLNGSLKDAVVDDLEERGIRAEIDLGWHGTGIGSEPNKYYSAKDGSAMTHKQVMILINN